jgi:NAD(P)-dependent dehydrogenase (short-subunit alcohol dehydrogenase family)
MATVLIAGASSGIGAATALAFARRGDTVVVNGRDPARTQAVVDALPGPGAHRAATGDLTDRAQRAAVLAEAGAIDHLVVAVSGRGGMGPFATLDLDELHAAFEGKLWAHLATLQAALPQLSDRGSIVLITAGSSRSALPGTAGLAAINGALDAVVGPLAAELAPIRVNAVSPGVIRTPWWDALAADVRQAAWDGFAAAIPAGRIGEADEVAEAIVALAVNGYVTGTVLDVSGGAQLATAGLG